MHSDVSAANTQISARALALKLLIYFAAIAGATAAVYEIWPDVAAYLPLGGVDIDVPDGGGGLKELRPMVSVAIGERLDAAFSLVASITGTVLLMVPITWVYVRIKAATGFERNFVIAILALPIVATGVVLLIQDSLPLAFGLAALVAAVRFRVSLKDALDGIFVFAAVGVGLASGVGFLGVAYVMAIFFCFVILTAWSLNYGVNRIEQDRIASKKAKLAQDAPRDH
jgi:hypothetical protein